MKKCILSSVLFLAALITVAQDQKFVDFQSARIAYDKYKDYDEAERLLKPLYSDFKDDMSYIHLYANVLKARNKHKEAFDLLVKFNAVNPNPEIEEEIAELNYKFKKEENSKALEAEKKEKLKNAASPSNIEGFYVSGDWWCKIQALSSTSIRIQYNEGQGTFYFDRIDSDGEAIYKGELSETVIYHTTSGSWAQGNYQATKQQSEYTHYAVEAVFNFNSDYSVMDVYWIVPGITVEYNNWKRGRDEKYYFKK